MNIELIPVCEENYRAVMALKVKDDQRRFVAPNILSLVQAAYEPQMYPLAVCANGAPVGLILYDFDRDLNGWSMSRFMIDAASQHAGIGGAALKIFLKWFDEKYPDVETLYTSAEVENAVALALYEKNGFVRGAAFEYDVDDMHFTEYRLVRTRAIR